MRVVDHDQAALHVARRERVADESPGYPCRQCLRDADVGEELVVFAWADPIPNDLGLGLG